MCARVRVSFRGYSFPVASWLDASRQVNTGMCTNRCACMQQHKLVGQTDSRKPNGATQTVRTQMEKRIRVGVDVGGTFTDFVMVDENRDEIFVGKQLTTPDDPSIAIIDGTKRIAREAKIAPIRNARPQIFRTRTPS